MTEPDQSSPGETGPVTTLPLPQETPAVEAVLAPEGQNEKPGPSLEAPPTPAARRASFWERPGWLALGLAVLLSLALSVALTLGVLAAANRGLSYASPADVKTLQAQVQTLQGRVDAQEQDLAGLRTRLEAVEKLAGRTTLLEQAAAGLQSELDKRAADLDSVRSALDSVRSALDSAKQQIEQVVTQSAAFDKFISGLRGLLQNLQPAGSPKP